MNSYDHSLDLGLGFPSSTHKTIKYNTNMSNPKPQQTMLRGEPSLTLTLYGETTATVVEDVSAASSLSNVVAVSVKRERETSSSDDIDVERGCSRIISDEEEEDGSCANITTTRKKLRLTKDQSAMLEDSFKHHSTLNPKQKQALAERLNLRPRQVEVWFQNRRARTKLKQTEVDCEYMKKWCETLTDENKRLQKEVQELKALKLVQPFYMHLPAATLSMCPSCERIGSGVPIIGTPAPVSSKSVLVMTPKSHFYPTQSNRPLLVDN